jgi:hypothetical protein
VGGHRAKQKRAVRAADAANAKQLKTGSMESPKARQATKSA